MQSLSPPWWTLVNTPLISCLNLWNHLCVKGVAGRCAQGIRNSSTEEESQQWWIRVIQPLPVDGELCKHISRRPGEMSECWSLKCVFTHSLGQHPDSATVIKSLGVGLSVNTSILPCLGEDGFPPASQIPSATLAALRLWFQIMTVNLSLEILGTVIDAKNPNLTQGIHVACYRVCSPCSSPSSASPEKSLCSVPHLSYLTQSLERASKSCLACKVVSLGGGGWGAKLTRLTSVSENITEHLGLRKCRH